MSPALRFWSALPPIMVVVPLALFFVVLAMCFGLILGVPRFLAAWRATDPDDSRPGTEAEPEQSPEVLHLAGGHGGDAEADDVEATWIGRRREP